MKRMLAIWFPNWPVQRLVSTRPELQNRAVVLHRTAARGRIVVACSARATKFGIRKDMPLVEVAALVRGKNRTLLSLESYDPSADRLALEKLAGRCHQYSPCVGIEDTDCPETLLLDVTGIGTLFEGEQGLLQQVAKGFQRLGLTAQMAVADNVGTAWAVSHYGGQDPAVMEMNVVDSGGSYAAIQSLPTAALRLPTSTIETLDRLGLKRIGELLMLPRVELQARFPSLLLQRLDQALGAIPEAIRTVQPPPEFIAEWSLECPLDRQDTVNQVIRQLLAQLVQRLTHIGEGVLRLICQLNCRPSPTIDVEVGLFQPSASSDHLMKLVAMHMERITLPGPVNTVSVHVTQHARLAWRQPGLFDQGQRQHDSSQVASLIEQMTCRLGRKAVLGCVLKSDPQPELAYREESLVDRAVRKRKTQSIRLSLDPVDRPLHLLSRPLRLQAFAVVPNGTPFRFRHGEQDHYIARHWGPERIETGWWRRRGVQRDYYRVETKSGQRFWLFRQIPHGEWFLHGVF